MYAVDAVASESNTKVLAVDAKNTRGGDIMRYAQ